MTRKDDTAVRRAILQNRSHTKNMADLILSHRASLQASGASRRKHPLPARTPATAIKVARVLPVYYGQSSDLLRLANSPLPSPTTCIAFCYWANSHIYASVQLHRGAETQQQWRIASLSLDETAPALAFPSRVDDPLSLQSWIFTCSPLRFRVLVRPAQNANPLAAVIQAGLTNLKRGPRYRLETLACRLTQHIGHMTSALERSHRFALKPRSRKSQKSRR